jgi:hypothetical protein
MPIETAATHGAKSLVSVEEKKEKKGDASIYQYTSSRYR